MSGADHPARSDEPAPEGSGGTEVGRGLPARPARPATHGIANRPGGAGRTAPEPGPKREGEHAEGTAPNSRQPDDANRSPLDERTWFLRPFRRKGSAVTFGVEVRAVPPGVTSVGFELQHRDFGSDCWTTAATFGPFTAPCLFLSDVTGLKAELRLTPRVMSTGASRLPSVRVLPPRWRP